MILFYNMFGLLEGLDAGFAVVGLDVGEVGLRDVGLLDVGLEDVGFAMEGLDVGLRDVG